MSYHPGVMSLSELTAQIDYLDPALPVAVAVTDLDRFAPLNEAHGPKAGDAVLESFERSLTGGLASDALIAHVRGDEFAIALPGMACEEALLALETVRAGFAGREAAPGLGERLAVSVGIAGRPAHGATSAELLEAADAGLVRAKRAGGNRIAIHVEERMILKSSYYPRPALHRLAKLSGRVGRPEASLLREALDEYLARHQDSL
jgi:diguanylate cyclase (GGDEF)-like protein